MKIEEIKTKEEFLSVLTAVIEKMDNYNQELTNINDKMKKPQEQLNKVLQQENYDESSHEMVQKCFDEFYQLKKCILKIELDRINIRNLISLKHFKQFYVNTGEYNAKSIDLKDNIEKHKRLLNDQIIKCLDYLSVHEVKITL